MSTKDEYPIGGGPCQKREDQECQQKMNIHGMQQEVGQWHISIGSCLTGYKLLKITKHAGKFMHKASYSGLSMNVALLDILSCLTY